MAMTNRAQNHNISSSSSTYRPEWVDVTTTARPSNGFSLGDNNNNQSTTTTTRKQFKSHDVRDIALQACPDSHTIR